MLNASSFLGAFHKPIFSLGPHMPINHALAKHKIFSSITRRTSNLTMNKKIEEMIRFIPYFYKY